MCADAGITLLTYVDNLLLFARGDETTRTLLADWREEFKKVAGLRPNVRKSNIYIARVDERTKGRLLEMTSFEQGCFLFHYLGILLAIEKLRRATIVH